MAAHHVIRPATTDDIDHLLRLRQVMFDAVDEPIPPSARRPGTPDWHVTCREFLTDGFAAGTIGAFVAVAVARTEAVSGAVAGRPGGGLDGAGGEGRIVGGGVGDIRRRLGGPQEPTGRYGHVASMATEPAWRSQGIGRAVVEALLGWFVAQGITRVELHATPAGEPIYRALGFGESHYPALRWTVDRQKEHA